jgi:SAM-dependent methyltransferase
MESHHDHQHRAAGETDPAAMLELLDLDAEVMHSYLSDVIGWVHEWAVDLPYRRILDIGAGTGSGALVLARQFAGASVIAVDMSAPLLQRLTEKARDLGVADRIQTVPADLDAEWPTIDTVDLVWASNSLHHMADPDRVLAEVFSTIRPGGLLAVAEMESFPRFLPDDIGVGRPGLEERCHAAAAERLAGELPHLGDDWSTRLRKARFAVEAERTFAIDLTHPLPAATRRYAQASLQRLRAGLDGRLSADDLATLATLLDRDSTDAVVRRDDLAVHSARTVWVARRP